MSSAMPVSNDRCADLFFPRFSTVTWRGQPYRILSDSRAAKMQSRSGNGQSRLRGLLDGVSASSSPHSSVARYEALSTSDDRRVMD